MIWTLPMSRRERSIQREIASLLGLPPARIAFDHEARISDDYQPGTWVVLPLDPRGEVEPVEEVVQNQAGRICDEEEDVPPWEAER